MLTELEERYVRIRVAAFRSGYTPSIGGLEAYGAGLTRPQLMRLDAEALDRVAKLNEEDRLAEEAMYRKLAEQEEEMARVLARFFPAQQ